MPGKCQLLPEFRNNYRLRRRKRLDETLKAPFQLLISCLFLAVVLGVTGAYGQASDKPADTVKGLLKAVKVLSEAKETDTNTDTIRQISRSFDLAGISRGCLYKTWDGLSTAERGNFVSLFQEVLEKVAYPKAAKFFKNTEVKIEQVDKDQDRVEVMTLVIHPEEGEVEVAYCLERVKGGWLISDILLDGVSLRVDLRSQMQKILREDSYDELKRRLREKLP